MSKKKHFANSKHKHQPIKLFAFRSIFRIFCVFSSVFKHAKDKNNKNTSNYK